MEDLNEIYSKLIDDGYFTEEELLLVTDGWGYTIETINIACQVRYAMDVDQLLDLEEDE